MYACRQVAIRVVTVVVTGDDQPRPSQTTNFNISGDAHFDNCCMVNGSSRTTATNDDDSRSTDSQYTVVVESQQ